MPACSCSLSTSIFWCSEETSSSSPASRGASALSGRCGLRAARSACASTWEGGSTRAVRPPGSVSREPCGEPELLRCGLRARSTAAAKTRWRCASLEHERSSRLCIRDAVSFASSSCASGEPDGDALPSPCLEEGGDEPAAEPPPPRRRSRSSSWRERVRCGGGSPPAASMRFARQRTAP